MAEAVQHPCVVSCPLGLEACLHRLRRLSPRELLFVDAALGLNPCECILTSLEEVAEKPVSSHVLTPSLGARLLGVRRAAVLAIGVHGIGVGSQPSPHIVECAARIAEWLGSILARCGSSCTLRDVAHAIGPGSPCRLRVSTVGDTR